MKIRTKILGLMVLYIFGIGFIAGSAIYSWYKNAQIQKSINLGAKLQLESKEVKSLMKDIVFDLFAPQMYGQIRSLTYSPRSAVTISQWQEAVIQYTNTFSEFMALSHFVNTKDKIIRDQYFTAIMMNDRAMEMLDRMKESLLVIKERYRSAENIYNEMQKDESFIPFFNRFQETSYYFSNSFESFMNYFIRSLGKAGKALGREILIVFVISSSAVLIMALILTIS